MTAEILDFGLQAARIEKGKVVFVLMNDSCVLVNSDYENQKIWKEKVNRAN